MKNLPDLLTTFRKIKDQADSEGLPLRDICLSCDRELLESNLYQRFRICPHCRFHYSLTAHERIVSLVDQSSFRETHHSLTATDPLSFSSRISYREDIKRDQLRTGMSEAAIIGTARIGGSPTVVIILDFSFLGGSMGWVVGEKITLAMEQALKKKLLKSKTFF